MRHLLTWLLAAAVIALHYVVPDLVGVSAMALIYIEGWDVWDASSAHNVAAGYPGSGMNGRVAGRFGGFAGRSGSGSVNQTKIFPSTYATLIFGFAYRTNTTSTANFFALTTAAGATIATLNIDGTGHYQVRNSGNTVIATGTAVQNVNAWNYLELKIFVNGASGTCELHVNGVTDIASTVGNFGSTNIGGYLFVSGSGFSNSQDMDDAYAVDTSGSAPRNTFLGDVRVATIFPTSDGAHTQWTPSAAGSHWSLVDEAATTYPNEDTDYVSDLTPGDYDTYGFQDVDGGATVYGVQVNLYARKDDASLRQIAPVIRQGGTDYDGTTVTLGATYAFFRQLYNQDPTGSDWTATNVNNDEYGVKVVT